MKKYNILKISFIFLLGVLVTSCGDHEDVIYEGNAEGQTFVGFSRETYNLQIEIDSEGVLNIPVQSSAVRNTDRTYNVNVIESLTTAEADTYNVPSTVTIPANERVAQLTITGVDNDVETTPETLTIELEPIGGESLGITTAEISVYQVCPIPSDYFVGEYTIEDGSATIGPNNGFANFGPATVNVSIGDSPTTRVFTATTYPGIGSSNSIEVSLVCGELVFSQEVNTNVQCTTDVPIIFTTAAAGGFPNGIYSIDGGDDTFTVNYTEDLNGSCGGPFLSSFILTKTSN